MSANQAGRTGGRPASAATQRPASAKVAAKVAAASSPAVASPATPAPLVATGAPNDNKVSKMLSQVLRHKATELGLKVRADGFIELSSVLELPDFKKKNVSVADITRVVGGNDKQRFELKAESAVQYIRAAQGHSLKEIASDELLTPVTDASLWPVCVHGTQYKLWDTIRRSGGLKRMARLHIHFASAPLGVAVSGMRPDSDLLFHLDIPTALAAGLKLYVSTNKILLTEGIDGMIPLKLFSRIERLEEGKLVDVPFDKNALPEEKKQPAPKPAAAPKQQQQQQQPAVVKQQANQPKAERKWANAAAGNANVGPTPAAAAAATVAATNGAPAKSSKKNAAAAKKAAAASAAAPSPSLRPLNSKLSATAPAWSPVGETATAATPVVAATTAAAAAPAKTAAKSVAKASTTPITAPIKKVPAVGTAAAIAAAAVASAATPAAAATATTVAAPAAVVAPVTVTPTAASIVASSASQPLPFVVAGQRQLGAPKRATKELVPQPATAAKKPAGKIGVTTAGNSLITAASVPVVKYTTDLCPFDYIAVLDFEATCDDDRKWGPHEVIEFPIAMLNTRTLRVDHVFHSYVRPVKIAKLTPFCTKLTGITQSVVDAAPTFEPVLDAIRVWLQTNDFLDENSVAAARPILTVKAPPPVVVVPAAATGVAARQSAPVQGAWASSKFETKKITAAPTPAETVAPVAAATPVVEAKNTTSSKKIKTFAIATCGDWDLKSMLPEQLALSNIICPTYFRSWINIKKIFAAHQRAKGKRNDQEKLGMPTMLSLLGLPLEGKHHSGIDDVKNLVGVCTRLLKDNVTPFDITGTSEKPSKGGKGGKGDAASPATPAANGSNAKAARKAALNAAAKVPKVQNVIAPSIAGSSPSAPVAVAVVAAPAATTVAPVKTAASIVAASLPAPAATPAVVAAPAVPIKTAASVVAAANAAALAAAKAVAVSPVATSAKKAKATVAAPVVVAAKDGDDGWTKASATKTKRGNKQPRA